MIFTDRKITIRNGKSSIDAPVVLYRGDFEVSIRFTIMESKFRFKSGVNLVDSEKASHGQLAILAPYGGNVFSEIVKCEDGTVTFTLTKEMTDQLEEVGLYSFQIRLFDYYRESRVSIPPVEFGIEVREPVASEDHDNEINNAIVGYSIAKVVDGLNEDVPDTFDNNGDYNKTNWKTGDRISQGKLNKIEDALDKINQNEKNDVAALDKRVTNNFNVLDSNKADKNEVNSKIWGMVNMGQDVKEAMTGGSVAVVGKNSVLEDNIVDNQISARKLSNESIVTHLLHKGGNTNLFNKNQIKNNGYINWDGSFVSNSSYYTSEPIYVLPNLEMTIIADWISSQGSQNRLHLYKMDGTHIQSIANATSPQTIITPTNVGYIRISLHKSAKWDNTMVLIGNTVPDDFIPFGANFDFIKSTVTNEVIEDESIDLRCIKKGIFDIKRKADNLLDNSLEPYDTSEFIQVISPAKLEIVDAYEDFKYMGIKKNYKVTYTQEVTNKLSLQGKLRSLSDLGLNVGDTATIGLIYKQDSLNSLNHELTLTVNYYTSTSTYLTSAGGAVYTNMGNGMRYAKLKIVIPEEASKIAIIIRNDVNLSQTEIFYFGGIYISKNNTNEIIHISEFDLKTENNNLRDKNIMFLGDSITADKNGWPKRMCDIIKPKGYLNLAVSGATWMDKADTIYDGNPTSSNNSSNCIGNQVQKAINQEFVPDIIIICAGTNDSNGGTDLEAQFTINSEYLSLEEVDRMTFAGAIRYSVETLLTKFPNAQIFISTPLQGAEGVRRYTTQKAKRDKIKETSERLSIPVFDAFIDSGIYGCFENYNAQGKYLKDGLHPNSAGIKKLGDYFAHKVLSWYNLY